MCLSFIVAVIQNRNIQYCYFLLLGIRLHLHSLYNHQQLYTESCEWFYMIICESDVGKQPHLRVWRKLSTRNHISSYKAIMRKHNDLYHIEFHHFKYDGNSYQHSIDSSYFLFNDHYYGRRWTTLQDIYNSLSFPNSHIAHIYFIERKSITLDDNFESVYSKILVNCTPIILTHITHYYDKSLPS